MAKVASQVTTVAAFPLESLCHPALSVSRGQLGSLRKEALLLPHGQLLEEREISSYTNTFACSGRSVTGFPSLLLLFLVLLRHFSPRKHHRPQSCGRSLTALQTPNASSPWGFQIRQTLFKMKIPSTGHRETKGFGDAMIEHFRGHPEQSP